MRMEDEDEPKGGKRDPLVLDMQPIAIPADEK